MTEPEIQFAVTCPVCRRESPAGFRFSVVAEALQTGDIRLYSSCHVAGWDASESELAQLREYLDATWSESLREACNDFSLDDFETPQDVAIILAGDLEEFGT